MPEDPQWFCCANTGTTLGQDVGDEAMQTLVGDIVGVTGTLSTVFGEPETTPKTEFLILLNLKCLSCFSL